MSSLISEELRRQVAARADHLCEYCLIHEEDGLLSFQVEHIMSRKHGGADGIGELGVRVRLL
jgi:5-methylcytosine-specific restriction endonuclease McrA